MEQCSLPLALVPSIQVCMLFLCEHMLCDADMHGAADSSLALLKPQSPLTCGDLIAGCFRGGGAGSKDEW